MISDWDVTPSLLAPLTVRHFVGSCSRIRLPATCLAVTFGPAHAMAPSHVHPNTSPIKKQQQHKHAEMQPLRSCIHATSELLRACIHATSELAMSASNWTIGSSFTVCDFRQRGLLATDQPPPRQSCPCSQAEQTVAHSRIYCPARAPGSNLGRHGRTYPALDDHHGSQGPREIMCAWASPHQRQGPMETSVNEKQRKKAALEDGQLTRGWCLVLSLANRLGLAGAIHSKRSSWKSMVFTAPVLPRHTGSPRYWHHSMAMAKMPRTLTNLGSNWLGNGGWIGPLKIALSKNNSCLDFLRIIALRSVSLGAAWYPDRKLADAASLLPKLSSSIALTLSVHASSQGHVPVPGHVNGH